MKTKDTEITFEISYISNTDPRHRHPIVNHSHMDHNEESAISRYQALGLPEGSYISMLGNAYLAKPHVPDRSPLPVPLHSHLVSVHFETAQIASMSRDTSMPHMALNSLDLCARAPTGHGSGQIHDPGSHQADSGYFHNPFIKMLDMSVTSAEVTMDTRPMSPRVPVISGEIGFFMLESVPPPPERSPEPPPSKPSPVLLGLAAAQQQAPVPTRLQQQAPVPTRATPSVTPSVIWPQRVL
jgi:hypothetical protein